jgi:hypothetical protein
MSHQHAAKLVEHGLTADQFAGSGTGPQAIGSIGEPMVLIHHQSLRLGWFIKVESLWARKARASVVYLNGRCRRVQLQGSMNFFDQVAKMEVALTQLLAERHQALVGIRENLRLILNRHGKRVATFLVGVETGRITPPLILNGWSGANGKGKPFLMGSPSTPSS